MDRLAVKREIAKEFNDKRSFNPIHPKKEEPSWQQLEIMNSLAKLEDRMDKWSESEKLEFIDDFNLEADEINLIEPELLEKHESVGRGEIKKANELTVIYKPVEKSYKITSPKGKKNKVIEDKIPLISSTKEWLNDKQKGEEVKKIVPME